MTQRKIVVHIATSADGYIARADGSFEWLNRPRTAGDHGMRDFFKTIDTILWGRKTYDQALEFGHTGDGLGFGKEIKNYVFTHRPAQSTDPTVEFVDESIKEFAARLRATAGKDSWIMGGGGIIASFLDAGEIDEFIIHLIPTFIGEGIPLVAPRHRNVQLELLSTHAYSDGVVRLHYSVLRAEPKEARKLRRQRRRKA